MLLRVIIHDVIGTNNCYRRLRILHPLADPRTSRNRCDFLLWCFFFFSINAFFLRLSDVIISRRYAVFPSSRHTYPASLLCCMSDAPSRSTCLNTTSFLRPFAFRYLRSYSYRQKRTSIKILKSFWKDKKRAFEAWILVHEGGLNFRLTIIIVPSCIFLFYRE